MKDVLLYVKKWFDYNEDGTFTRRDRKGSSGSKDKDGYLILKIKGKQYKAHRVVWAYFNDEFPGGEIDHINRVRDDNRIENLRVVDRIGNIENTTRSPNRDTGIIGVYLDKSTKGLLAKYTTRIDGKSYRFRSLDNAIMLRKEKGLKV